ncbi:hypothetical protein Hanom_Chr17g01555761 [Helianthus anomalus]
MSGHIIIHIMLITILVIILLLTTRKLPVLSGTRVNFCSTPSQNQSEPIGGMLNGGALVTLPFHPLAVVALVDHIHHPYPTIQVERVAVVGHTCSTTNQCIVINNFHLLYMVITKNILKKAKTCPTPFQSCP